LLFHEKVAPHLSLAGLAAEFFLFLEIVIAACAAAKAAHAINRLVAVPATSLRLQTVQTLRLASQLLSSLRILQIGARTSFNHVFLLVSQLDAKQYGAGTSEFPI
jgi:hypothetical protein